MIATIRDREQLVDKERIKNQGDRADELADQVARLQEKLERYEQDSTHYRVLISATIDKTIEVFADPQVKVKVICLPETNNEKDASAAIEWALGQLPHEFKGIMDDCTIRPELHSILCMDRIHFRYYRDRMEAFGYLKALGEAVEEIVKEQPATTDQPW